MKKITMMIAVFSLAGATAFAAVPAFDSPEQEQAYYQQEAARQAFEETRRGVVFSENGRYSAVPAFNSPQEEQAHWQQEQERAAFADRVDHISYN